jgi:predicted phage terminase large subunit-like protein
VNELSLFRPLPPSGSPEHQRLVAAILRKDLACFVRRVATTVVPAGLTWNWHLDAICHALEQVRLGTTRRLIINLPPRSLKSVIASVAFPAFVLGHDPSKRIICVSYAQDLATKHSNDFRALLGSDWYRRIFTRTRPSDRKNTEAEVQTTLGGMRLATSVGGTLTGRGGSLIIIDDPIKPDDALSATTRDSCSKWFSNTLLSRLDNKVEGAVVIVMQRVHMDDLVGYVTRQTGTDWTVLNLPAVSPADLDIPIGEGRTHRFREGSLLHPEREPQHVLDDLRANLGSDSFSAQYLQQPVPPGGAMIKRKWISRYRETPTRKPGQSIIQSWDTAAKGGPGNDWSVCSTWLVARPNYYLLHIHRGRHDFPELRHKAIELSKRYNPTRILIEDIGAGTALHQELRKMGLPARAIKVNRDKQVRMAEESVKFENGFVHLPETAAWLPVLEDELFAFPGGRHDDQVDSISQALKHGASGYQLTAENIG